VRVRPQKGGLFPEDGRRKKPSLSFYEPEYVPENGRDGVRARVAAWLRSNEVVCAVTDAGLVDGKRRMVYPAGWPDITAVLPVTGRAWLIECKTITGELEDSQRDLHPQLLVAGALLTIARNVEDVARVLDEHLSSLTAQQRIEYYRALREARREARERRQEKAL
jgi:hypothetical protein